MSGARIIGTVSLIVGIVILALGIHISDAPVNHVSDTLTGHYTGKTMWYLIAGIIGIVGGGLLALFGKRV